MIIFFRFGWSDCFTGFSSIWSVVYVCKLNLKCFPISVTCNILFYDSRMYVCLFVLFLVFASFTLIAGSWVFESCIVWLAGICLTFCTMCLTTTFVSCCCRCCLMSLPYFCYGCTVIEYLYRDRCNNGFFTLWIYCFLWFVSLLCSCGDCVCEISIQNISLYQKEIFPIPKSWFRGLLFTCFRFDSIFIAKIEVFPVLVYFILILNSKFLRDLYYSKHMKYECV